MGPLNTPGTPGSTPSKARPYLGAKKVTLFTLSEKLRDALAEVASLKARVRALEEQVETFDRERN
jgi:CII-binding regulator of phage lambda lysogenization HflD